jgi:hypothetical protein
MSALMPRGMDTKARERRLYLVMPDDSSRAPLTTTSKATQLQRHAVNLMRARMPAVVVRALDINGDMQ